METDKGGDIQSNTCDCIMEESENFIDYDEPSMCDGSLADQPTCNVMDLTMSDDDYSR